MKKIVKPLALACCLIMAVSAVQAQQIATPEFNVPDTVIYRTYGDIPFSLDTLPGITSKEPTISMPEFQFRSSNPAVATVTAVTAVTPTTAIVTIVGVGETGLFVRQIAPIGVSLTDSEWSDSIKVVVLPKGITVRDTIPATKVYDATSMFNAGHIDITGATLSGVLTGDDVALSKEDVTGTSGPDVGTDTLIITRPFTLTGDDAANYTLAKQPTVEATITPKEIIVTAVSGSSNYGDTPTNPGLSATGLASSHSASVLTGLYNSFNILSTTPPGSYTLTVEGTLTNPNYTDTARVQGTWTVNKRPITVTARNITIKEGETPVLTYDITSGSLVHGDQLTGELACAPPYTVGTHAITQGTLTAPPNYELTFIPGTLTVLSTNVEINEILVNGEAPERNGDNFFILAKCGDTSVEVNVNADQYATVTINGVQRNPSTVSLPDYGDNTLNIIITAQAGNTQTYKLTVHRSVPVAVAFYDRFKDVLTVPIRIDGISADITSVEWYHNNVRLSRDASKGYLEMVDAGVYYALLNGAIRTCEVVKGVTALSAKMTVSPNPAGANQQITVDIACPADQLQGARLQLYSIDGNPLKTVPVTGNNMTVEAPARSGLIIVKLITNSGNEETKLIVK